MNHAVPLSNTTPVEPPEDKTIEVEDLEHRLKLISENDVVVIKYSAVWCGPCKAIAGEYKYQLPDEFPDVTWCEEDIDEEFGELAEDIKSIPTFHIFKDHKFVDSIKGKDLNAVRKALE
jgi:thioredoxin 1